MNFTRQDVEDALFGGDRIGDMSRDELFDVILYYFQALENADKHHKSTLDAWSLSQLARSQGKW